MCAKLRPITGRRSGKTGKPPRSPPRLRRAFCRPNGVTDVGATPVARPRRQSPATSARRGSGRTKRSARSGARPATAGAPVPAPRCIRCSWAAGGAQPRLLPCRLPFTRRRRRRAVDGRARGGHVLCVAVARRVDRRRLEGGANGAQRPLLVATTVDAPRMYCGGVGRRRGSRGTRTTEVDGAAAGVAAAMATATVGAGAGGGRHGSLGRDAAGVAVASGGRGRRRAGGGGGSSGGGGGNGTHGGRGLSRRVQSCTAGDRGL